MKPGTGLVAAPQSPFRGVVAALVVMAWLLSGVSHLPPVQASNLLVNGSLESYYTYATDPGTGTPLTVGSGCLGSRTHDRLSGERTNG